MSCRKALNKEEVVAKTVKKDCSRILRLTQWNLTLYGRRRILDKPCNIKPHHISHIKRKVSNIVVLCRSTFCLWLWREKLRECHFTHTFNVCDFRFLTKNFEVTCLLFYYFQKSPNDEILFIHVVQDNLFGEFSFPNI